jgi:hypothetical protein
MDFKLCAACGQRFTLRPQVPTQRYCSTPSCQRERHRRWQQDKRQSDPDYRDNQARAQQAWSQRNRDYWSTYRDSHPEYAKRNRKKQIKRNARRKSTLIAKMDASTPVNPPPSGIYRLSPVTTSVIAKMDAWIVELTVLSGSHHASAPDCKERT